jgi:hypothetical protein
MQRNLDLEVFIDFGSLSSAGKSFQQFIDRTANE